MQVKAFHFLHFPHIKIYLTFLFIVDNMTTSNIHIVVSNKKVRYTRHTANGWHINMRD